MSFERTKGSIANLSNGTEVSLDSLLDMLVCAAQDVMEHNRTSDLATVNVGDRGVLLKKEYNLLQMLLSIYEANKSGLSEFSASIQDKYGRLVAELNDVLSEISESKNAIEKAESKGDELQRKYDELHKTRAHLLTIGEECERIQRQIDVLSDPALDEMERKKAEMQLDLSQRKGKVEKIETEKDEIQKQLDNVALRTQELKELIEKLQTMTEQKQDEENELLREKNGLEKGIENLKAKLKEYQNWLDNFAAMEESIRNDHDEKKARITMAINAFNSVMSEEYIKSVLFHESACANGLTIDEHPDASVVAVSIMNVDDLNKWFVAMKERIEALIDIYENALASIVKKSETITDEVQGNKE